MEYMFNWKSVLRITLLLIVVLAITSCGGKVKVDDLTTSYFSLGKEAQDICNSKGREYTQHYTIDGKNWIVKCHTISPLEFTEYEVTK